MTRTCKCGCGNEIVYKPHHKYHKPDYINNHAKNHLGHKHTEETKEKMRLSVRNSTNWKGDNVKYRALHQWVRKYLPQPDSCQMCKEVKKLTLSNRTGVYNRDFHNWLYLCYKCHNWIDRI